MLKQHIKMLTEAKKIQKSWKPQNGDRVYFCNSIRIVINIGTCWFLYYADDSNRYSICAADALKNNEHILWLPYQIQFQKMAAKMPTWTDTRPTNVLCRFWSWWRDSDWELCSDDTTLEQLWLCFVMKERFNKRWNNEIEKWEEM